MFNRRRLTVFALLLTLVLAPGLSLAGQRGRAATADQSPFERLMAWAERAWDAVTGNAPQGHVIMKAGCGIDPNGCPTGGGGGTTSGTTSGGH